MNHEHAFHRIEEPAEVGRGDLPIQQQADLSPELSPPQLKAFGRGELETGKREANELKLETRLGACQALGRYGLFSDFVLEGKRTVKPSPVDLRLFDGGGARTWIECHYVQVLPVAHAIGVTRNLPRPVPIPAAHFDSRACDLFDVNSTPAVLEVDKVALSYVMDPRLIRCEIG